MGTHPIFESDFDCLTDWMGGLDLECVITFEGKCPIDHCGETIYFIKEDLEEKTRVHCRQCGNNVSAESILDSIETKVNQSIIEASNQSKSCIPGHADPDGHCLVHAISRCLTGTQLFWHPLREELHRHLRSNLTKYQQLLGAYITECEWPLIVEEADPYYLSDGAPLGLRNVHVFALANILKRPIILLDSPDCMDNAGDFSATFLPILTPPKYCKDKQDKLNSPIVIAWASRAHNHFVPIIPISAIEVMLPNSIIPPVWLETQDKINEYCEFKYTEYCPRGVTIGHGTKISDNYIKRLITAMREAFHTEENISTNIVSRLYRDV